MQHVGAIVGALAFAAVANADTVKGELTFNSKGIGKIRECKSGRVISVGEMSLNQYLQLDEQYWRLSYQGKTPVVVEMRGGITREGPPGTELVLQSPYVVRLIRGRCAEDEARASERQKT
jgi:hypothetical protein